ncbi:MAG: nucleotide-binding protein [Polaromonas sp.]|nr:nucleotide-binding protein [Polaromonas sp.]
MSELAIVMAKLSGIRKAVVSVMEENVSRHRSSGEVLTRTNYAPDSIGHYFRQAASHLAALKVLVPDLYSDFQVIKIEPETVMAAAPDGTVAKHYSRSQADRLIRDIDQIFEIRANSELAQPKQEAVSRVFITHGRSNDWRAVQPFIERDVKLLTIELAQEANLGRTIIEKLIDNASRCNSAVIVMTGDDVAGEDESRVRENVMHEIGFFQGRYGRNFVVLLHEDGVNVPTNLAGVAYIPYPKGNIEAGFHVLRRELDAMYKKT